jgi:Glyoxalase/Bleomycin resistance protein/Dioxygenase superfamily
MQARLDSLLRQYESGRITRRDLIASLAFVVASCATASYSGSLYRATELNHVTLRVRHLKRSKEFYQGLLGLPVMQEDDQLCYLRSGTGFLCLVQADEGMRNDSITYALVLEVLTVQLAWRSCQPRD